MSPMHVQTLVVGAGIQGLATAWHAARYGSVALLEAHRFFHKLGSSHGVTRITRSVYHTATYARMMTQTHREAWPELEQEVGEKLVFYQDGVMWGPAQGPLAQYTRSVREAGSDVVVLSPREARRQFPAFHFEEAEHVLWDRTGGVVAAERTLRGLARCAQQRGAVLLDEVPMSGLELGDPITVTTPRGVFTAERLVLCLGPWASPWLARLGVSRTLIPTQQTVGYWDARDPLFQAPDFPVWVHLGETGLHYGIPGFPGQSGFKAAYHRTSGVPDDPNAPRIEGELAGVDAFLRQQLAVEVPRRVGAETCFYTNTATEDFILDTLPSDRRVVIGAGFSGHGFKFGPLIGKILAALAWGQPTGVAGFESDRQRFGV